MGFRAADIIWIKHITYVSNEKGVYMEYSEGDIFNLTFPEIQGNRKNMARPKKNIELILLYQKIKGEQKFSHLVFPIDDASDDDIVETGNDKYPVARQVKVYKKKLIPVLNTLWKAEWLKGPNRGGRVCEITKTTNIMDPASSLLQNIWDKFHV